MEKFDINKPYTTPDKHEVSAVLAPNGHYFGFIVRDGKCVEAAEWDQDGRWCRPTGPFYEMNGRRLDLINVPEKRTVKVWINVYAPGSHDGGQLVTHYSREDAQDCSVPGRIACIEREITYTVGEGL